MPRFARCAVVLLAPLLLAGLAAPAAGHFLTLLPSRDVVVDPATVLHLDLLFTHPMEQGPVMELALPRQFGVLLGGKRTDLLSTLVAQKTDGKTTYTCDYRPAGPGDFIFYCEPTPYWEPSEAKMIVHYTKVVVDALGAEEGWDALVGFPVEIEPLVRPYGLWAGNTFRGLVRHNGQPAPFATIEVEYYNAGRRVKIPNPAFTTQVIKADGQGVFSYTMPRAGWWGFAALIDGPQQENPTGHKVETELGGVMWVRTEEMEIGRLGD